MLLCYQSINELVAELQLAKSDSKRASHTNLQHVAAMERYSDSADEQDTNDCFMDFHDMAEFPRVIANPEIER